MSNDDGLSVFGAELLHRFASRLGRGMVSTTRGGVKVRFQYSGYCKSRWPDSRRGNPQPGEPRNPEQDTRPKDNSNSEGSVQMLDGFGLEFRFLKSSELTQLGLTTATGLLVTAVAIGSLAEQSGLRSGMVIYSINRSESGLFDDRDESDARSSRKCRWLMQVWSSEGPATITVVIP